MVNQFAVDLIVVAANGLDSRQIYDCMNKEVVQGGCGLNSQDDDRNMVVRNTVVAWGGLEIPKLASLS